MIPQMTLDPFTQILYAIFVDLNQPFTFKECLSAVHAHYPACKKKTLRSRIKEMVRKKHLEKQRIKHKILYRCLIDKNLVPVVPTPKKPSRRLHFFLCEL